MTTESTTAYTGSGGTTSSAAVAAVSRKTFVRALVVAAMIGAGWVGVQTLERSLNLSFDKPPMPLRKPLSQMVKRLGEGRYVADRPDDTMEEDVLQVLGTRDYLLRAFTDTKKQSNEPGSTLALNVNYYPTGNSTPHVPEICWAGSGLEEVKELRKVFVVKNVTRGNGTVEDIRMHLISFKMPDSEFGDGSSSKVYKNVAYLFEVNGDCVATPKEVISGFWKASNPHAFHSKIEVTVQQPCTQEEAENVISDFIHDALPAVEECLPAKELPLGSGQSANESVTK
ncbi:MAG TPA: exosortase-associated EpsI family protein [Phycisphaerae bacterium]|nr:exosortase-associated EpsI family protein [Phycisphaerae bacterium]